MTTFRFNFSSEEDIQTPADSSVDTKEDIKWLETCEVLPDKQLKDIDLIGKHAKMFTCGDIEIGHVIINEVISKIQDTAFKNVVQLAENNHSDLIAGQYEGGLKIWECTSDLIEYFEKNKDEINFENKQVLDLGSGAGILGIYAFMKRARVTFQDYNKEVLELVTIPNVLLNIEEEERDTEITRCKFYCGDWASFNKKCHDVFDIIITSETIYNECNYEKLISVFLDRLSKNGLVYVAAKTYYFGVGGGIRQFEKIIKEHGSLTSEVCWRSSGGIQREILKITRKLP